MTILRSMVVYTICESATTPSMLSTVSSVLAILWKELLTWQCVDALTVMIAKDGCEWN